MAYVEDMIHTGQTGKKIKTVCGDNDEHTQAIVLYGTKSNGDLDALKTNGSGKIQVVFA